MRLRLHYDDVAWEKSEEIIDTRVQQLLDPEVLASVGNFLVKYRRPNKPGLFDVLAKGAFNILFKITYKNTSAAVIRFPQPGAIMFPEEKLRNEVAIMRYIRGKTSIPVPFIYHWGNKDQSPLKLAGVVDLEFTYAAPVEFSYAPPWWLLIEKPEYWPQGLDDWCMQYERQLQTFLKALTRHEDVEMQNGRLISDQRLSSPMEASWRSGDFWVVYAAMNNFAFDSIYWQRIDQRYFGSATCALEDVWQQRLDLLEPEERDEMEKYVALKVEEMESRVLAWDPDEYTLEFAKTKLESQTTKEGDENAS
ncbi:uncharacterized protein N7473_011253 [Penicillium subrubescens]|uniref:Aminoglycoside phosphotransferase domain-containing protein n=1 Tax=Penicillium subrubescens TaxID=1316194 RepID=A0A1Q5U5F5_9EURO|nr:uncharacterized protein N7473_011253 [Penicillium subrubescens]KAJ5880200.1 hypothetical protein N7473_011253 [Penicillium subrubescens]OKP07697.1 hypothetical protein PENSUB_5812 [Penicillium subrubescens]